MGTMNMDLGDAHGSRSAEARHAAKARKWMEAQTTNVLAEARSRETAAQRLDDVATHGNAAARLAVAGNPVSDPMTLVFLSSPAFLTSKIAQRLSRNASTPLEALRNINRSPYATWFGNRARVLAHPNWRS